MNLEQLNVRFYQMLQFYHQPLPILKRNSGETDRRIISHPFSNPHGKPDIPLQTKKIFVNLNIPKLLNREFDCLKHPFNGKDRVIPDNQFVIFNHYSNVLHIKNCNEGCNDQK